MRKQRQNDKILFALPPPPHTHTRTQFPPPYMHRFWGWTGTGLWPNDFPVLHSMESSVNCADQEGTVELVQVFKYKQKTRKLCYVCFSGLEKSKTLKIQTSQLKDLTITTKQWYFYFIFGNLGFTSDFKNTPYVCWGRKTPSQIRDVEGDGVKTAQATCRRKRPSTQLNCRIF